MGGGLFCEFFFVDFWFDFCFVMDFLFSMEQSFFINNLYSVLALLLSMSRILQTGSECKIDFQLYKFESATILFKEKKN